MNFRDSSPQGAKRASEQSQSECITPSASTAASCTNCAGRGFHGALPRSHPSDPMGDQSGDGPHDGSNLAYCLCGEPSCTEQRRILSQSNVAESPKKSSSAQPEGLVQFLMAQNEHLAERLSKAETMLASSRTQDDGSETSHCPGSEADDEDEDGDAHFWKTVKLAMNERQQAEESLQEECRQLREGLSHMLSLVGLTMAHFDPKDMSAILLPGLGSLPDGIPLPDTGVPLDMNVFDGPQFAYDKIKKRGMMRVQMKDMREGLRIVTKICTILCLMVGIVALLRLPEQLSGPLSVVHQKQRGMGVWLRW